MQDAEWDDRYLQMTYLDNSGQLYIAGGALYDVGRFTMYQDVWRSTISFHDLPAVERACGITIPACGTGLRCWPGPGTMKSTDGTYVSCEACPAPDAAAASHSMVSSTAYNTVLAFMIIFLIMTLVAAPTAVVLLRKLQATRAGWQQGKQLSSTDTAIDTGSLLNDGRL